MPLYVLLHLRIVEALSCLALLRFGSLVRRNAPLPSTAVRQYSKKKFAAPADYQEAASGALEGVVDNAGEASNLVAGACCHHLWQVHVVIS